MDLPHPWQAFQDNQGRTYYVNTETTKSQWERPDFAQASTGPHRPANNPPLSLSKRQPEIPTTSSSSTGAPHPQLSSSGNPHRVGVDNGLVAQDANTASFANNTNNAVGRSMMASPVQSSALVDLQSVLCQPLSTPLVCGDKLMGCVSCADL